MDEEAEAGAERQQLGWGAAAMEEGDKKAGLKRQQVGRGAAGGPERQRPRRKGMRKQGRRGSRWAGEAAA